MNKNWLIGQVRLRDISELPKLIANVGVSALAKRNLKAKAELTERGVRFTVVKTPVA